MGCGDPSSSVRHSQVEYFMGTSEIENSKLKFIIIGIEAVYAIKLK